MRCVCGICIPFPKASRDHRCLSCGKTMIMQTDDYLLHGANGLVKEIRPGQVEMGRLVEKGIMDRAIVMVEGPVGSGKSFGYIIPTALLDKRTVISTAKKQLQHQLALKDLPYISERMNKPIRVALLKGKSNYACWVKLYDIPKNEQAAFKAWLEESEYGDLTDYPGKRPFFWADVTAEDCVGSACMFAEKGTCGYWKAKQQTKGAQVIIANHHITAFDLRFGPGKLLGVYDNLIIDEAHQAPAAFRGAYSKTLSQYGAKRILKQIDKAGLTTGVDKRLESAWDAMFDRIKNLDGEIPKDPFGSMGDDAIECLQLVNEHVKHELQQEGVKYTEDEGDEGDYENETETKLSKSHVDWEQVAKLSMAQRSVVRPLEALQEAKEPHPNTVVFITTTEKKSKIVNVAPIEVGGMVGPKLLQIPSVIVTSATIAVNNTFDDIRRQLGLSDTLTKPCYEQILETPFDYNKQALLYTPKHLPLPANTSAPDNVRADYYDAMSTEIFRLLRASGGNAFVLFSSAVDLREIHMRLQCEDLDTPLITQGDDAASALKEFLATPRSVILGLKSFWEGVDVVGDKLHLVIITKLPFPNISDPVIQARSRNFKVDAVQRGMAEQAAETAVFQTVMIPAMLTDLRQGAGRLIRSKKDKGVLAILDVRVWTGSGKHTPKPDAKSYHGYGGVVVNALGYSQRTSDFNLVSKFLSMLQRQESVRVTNECKVDSGG